MTGYYTEDEPYIVLQSFFYDSKNICMHVMWTFNPERNVLLQVENLSDPN